MGGAVQAAGGGAHAAHAHGTTGGGGAARQKASAGKGGAKGSGAADAAAMTATGAPGQGSAGSTVLGATGGGAGGASGCGCGGSAGASGGASMGGGGHAHGKSYAGGGDAHGGGGHLAPQLSKAGDPRFLAGTVGPLAAKEGDAKTVKIPDGDGFGGAKGTRQNGNDKKQNNYSVTDANYNPRLGLLAKNPDTGGEMNYVQHIQTYNAAGYLATFAPAVYQKLVAAQDAGQGTVLGGAAKIMGLVKADDPSMAGLTAADLAAVPQQIPGTTMSAKAYVQSGKDITGQNWARMHHPESAWAMYASMLPFVEQGRMSWQDAMVLAGDDGVSGSGRLNGVNNQDGKDSFNQGEIEVWAKAATYGQDVVAAMMSGHNHNDQPRDAMTNPNINKLLGLQSGDRTVNAGRVAAITEALTNGKVGDNKDATAGGTKADNKNLLGKA